MSWPLVAIGDVAEILSGNAWKSSQFTNESEGRLPIIRIQNISDVATDFIYWDGVTLEKYIIKDGDLLLSLSGNVKLCEWSFGNALLNQRIVKLAPTACVDKRYFYWALHRVVAEIEAMARHAVIANVSVTDLKEFQIPLPPLPEQKRIAAILDKADAIRRKRQQAIQLADDFLRAVFLHMFGDPVTNPKGWPVDKFGNVFDVRDGTHDSPSYVESGFPLITSKNIKNGEIDMSDVNYISKEDYELINRRSKVDVGDILMPMIGTIGNPAVVHDEPFFAIKNVALIKLGKSSLPAGFVLALLNGPLLEVAVQQKSRGGTQKFLGLGDIRDLNCYLPDERLVSKYIGIANKVRQYASAYRKADEAGLDSSLSQKAFSGQL